MEFKDCREMSKFGHFNNLQIHKSLKKRVKKLQKLSMSNGKLIKNEMLLKKIIRKKFF